MNTDTTYSIALEITSRILNDERLANRQSLIEYIDSVLQRRLNGEGRESTVAESVDIPEDKLLDADLRVAREVVDAMRREMQGAFGTPAVDFVIRAIVAARDSERERCAKFAERRFDNRWETGYRNAGLMIASAIRMMTQRERSSVSQSGLGVTSAVAVKLLALREAIAKGDGFSQDGSGVANAWHILYSIADPTFESLTPWAALESLATTQPDDDLKIQNVESQVSVSALPESGFGSESSGSPLPPPRAENQNKDQKLG